MNPRPPANGQRCVVVCETVHDVVALEHALKTAGLWCDTLPTPRQISSDCGMALQFAAADLDALQNLDNSGNLRWQAVYRELDNGFELV